MPQHHETRRTRDRRTKRQTERHGLTSLPTCALPPPQTLLLAYNAIITFYSYHGLGSQLLDVMTTADVRLAVVFENVLFDLASVGLLVAKGSLVSFLMRLVPQHHSPLRWRLLIIGPLACLAVVSLGAILAYWARCFAELSGDTLLCSSIVPAMRWMQAAAALSVAVDLWYAALPWYLLRRLSRPRREKVLIQGSMSLGVIAAGCGIARTLSIEPAANNSDPASGMSFVLALGRRRKKREPRRGGGGFRPHLHRDHR